MNRSVEEIMTDLKKYVDFIPAGDFEVKCKGCGAIVKVNQQGMEDVFCNLMCGEDYWKRQRGGGR